MQGFGSGVCLDEDPRVGSFQIDAQLKHLEKRLLAIRNPLLAGTEPASEEEAKAQAGMDNADRARRTEEKIEELRRSLDELGTGDE